MADVYHLHPKIDFLKLREEAIPSELSVHVYLFPGEQVSPSEISACKSQLESLAPLGVKIFDGDEDFNSVASNVRTIGVILESIVSFETIFLEMLVLAFRNTDTFCMYSDFKNSSRNIFHEEKLPAWSPIRFERVDYLGPVLALDLSTYLADAKSHLITREEVISFARINNLRISRAPLPLYNCETQFIRKDKKTEDLRIPESVSIVIPTQGLPSANGSLLEKCVAGLVKQAGVTNIELIVVADKGYDDRAVSNAKESLSNNFTFKLIEFNESFNFSRKCNLGASEATGEVVVFLNDDVELLSSDSIGKLSAWSLLAGVGAVGSQLQFPDGSIQHAGITLQDVKPRNSYLDQFPRVTDLGDLEFPHEVTGVTGACFAVSRDIFEISGGWNEELPNSYNDVDFCLRLNNMGYQSIVINDLEIVHNESSSRDGEFDLSAFEILKKLWSDELNSERYLRSTEASGNHPGPWGSHHGKRSDFTGNPLGYAWHIFSTQGIRKLLKAILQRLSGRTNRVLSLTKKEYL